jgi:pimeloyl-ACP methyl ester carboxylesterase
MRALFVRVVLLALLVLPGRATGATVEVPFTSHDGLPMVGKLTLPDTPGPHPVVVYVQTAEGMTADAKRLGPKGTFNYFDLYRTRLPAVNVGFFSYEGRGIRGGDAPPRYEAIDWPVYNTSTLENKVRDALSAVAAVATQKGVASSRIFLMGTSEGTLLAAEAASRTPGTIRGLILYAVMAAPMPETFTFILTDGAFIAYRGFFDTNRDGVISRAEFEADPRRYRERVFRNAPFANFDRNGDGTFTAADMPLLSKTYLDAVEQRDYEVLNRWARTSSGMTTPDNWFKDHFEHAALWTFLSRLDMPVGLFHGDADSNTSVEALRELERRARDAGKSNLAFHYFEGLDHTLGLGDYFARGGALPAGHETLFEFIVRQTR